MHMAAVPRLEEGKGKRLLLEKGWDLCDTRCSFWLESEGNWLAIALKGNGLWP
jgi:hypothetical protein